MQKDKITITATGVRLDTVVFKHYGDLMMFDSVLTANPDLHTVFIPVGFVVNLPLKVVPVLKDKLW